MSRLVGLASWFGWLIVLVCVCVGGLVGCDMADLGRFVHNGLVQVFLTYKIYIPIDS